MPHGLTPKMKKVFDFVEEYVRENTYAPSYHEIMIGVGLRSKSGVHRIIVSLEERGWIRRADGFSRSIYIVPRAGVPHYFAAPVEQDLRATATVLGKTTDELLNIFVTEGLLAIKNKLVSVSGQRGTA